MIDRPTDPSVSILVPTLDEIDHIDDILRAAESQSYDRGRLEVIVADGGSTDGTRAAVDRYESNIEVRLVDNPERHQSAGLNVAAEFAEGDVLVRWDAHADYPSDYVERVVDALLATGADLVGGRWDPVGLTRVGDWVAGAMQSRIGVGNARFAIDSVAGQVDSVMCGALWRDTFGELGGFDTTMRPAGEDADLSFRLRKRGGVVWFDPAINAVYHPRSSVAGVIRQYSGYGDAKAHMLTRHGVFPSLRPLAPVGLVAAFVGSAAVPSARRWLPQLVLAYVGAVLGISIARVPGSIARRLGAGFAAMTMHVSYGVGFWLATPKRIVNRLRTR